MKNAIVTETIEAAVQFHHLDPMNVVWHGNYPRFMEVARMALLNRLGYGYSQMVESGYSWPVTEMNIRYAQIVQLDTPLMVTAGIVEWENRLKMAFDFRHGGTNKRLTTAHSVQVAVHMETGELQWETPSVFRAALEPYL